MEDPAAEMQLPGDIKAGETVDVVGERVSRSGRERPQDAVVH